MAIIAIIAILLIIGIVFGFIASSIENTWIIIVCIIIISILSACAMIKCGVFE